MAPATLNVLPTVRHAGDTVTIDFTHHSGGRLAFLQILGLDGDLVHPCFRHSTPLETDSLVTDNRLCQLCKQGCLAVVLRALVQLRWPCCSQFLRAENRLYGYRISGPWRESDHGPVILSWREPIIVRTHLPNATSIRKLGTLRMLSGYLCMPNGGRLRSVLPVLRYQEYDGGADMFYK